MFKVWLHLLHIQLNFHDIFICVENLLVCKKNNTNTQSSQQADKTLGCHILINMMTY